MTGGSSIRRETTAGTISTGVPNEHAPPPVGPIVADVRRDGRVCIEEIRGAVAAYLADPVVGRSAWGTGTRSTRPPRWRATGRRQLR